MNNKLPKWKLLKDFLKARRSLLIVYLLTVNVFSLVYILSRLPLDLLFYSIELTIFLFLLFLFADFYRYFKRHQLLYALNSQNLPLLDDMPASTDPLEEVYKELIFSLRDQLQESEKQANEKHSEQLDYFTLWLHQVKTPISAIGLLVQSSKENPELGKKVNQELLRLEDYTRMALSYLKIENTESALDFEKVSLDETIKKTVKKYSILFIYNHISLEYEETHLQVLTDGTWLQVLLEQIVSNSLKYAPEGRIKIYLDPQKKETLVIEDNGIGIRSEDLPKIFNKGYSGMNGRLHEKSTGLGLFLSQMICERLGHSLQIESTLDKGTKVFIDFSREDLTIFE